MVRSLEEREGWRTADYETGFWIGGEEVESLGLGDICGKTGRLLEQGGFVFGVESEGEDVPGVQHLSIRCLDVKRLHLIF